ncbi:hypothetical protein ACWC5C_21105 [Streptomyces sp. NPDC001700]
MTTPTLQLYRGGRLAADASIETLSFCLDHPAWTHAPSGYYYRIFTDGRGAKWLATWGDTKLDLRPIDGRTEDADLPEITYTELPSWLGEGPIPIVRSLASLGTVMRISTLCLWEALSAAVIMQGMPTTIGRAHYRQWCRLYGAHHSHPEGPVHTAPGAKVVLSLPHRGFADTGMGHDTARVLRSAAAAYLEQADDWSRYSGERLVTVLRHIPGLTLSAAATAVVDYTGDGSCYPLASALDGWISRAPVNGHEQAPRLREAVETWAFTPGRRHALTLAILAREHRAPTP